MQENIISKLPKDILNTILSYMDQSTLVILLNISKFFKDSILNHDNLADYSHHLSALKYYQGKKKQKINYERIVLEWLTEEKNEIEELKKTLEGFRDANFLEFNRQHPTLENFKKHLQSSYSEFSYRVLARKNPYFNASFAAVLLLFLILTPFAIWQMIEDDKKEIIESNLLNNSPAVVIDPNPPPHSSGISCLDSPRNNITQQDINDCKQHFNAMQHFQGLFMSWFIAETFLIVINLCVGGFRVCHLRNQLKENNDLMDASLQALKSKDKITLKEIQEEYPEIDNPNLQTIKDLYHFIEDYLKQEASKGEKMVKINNLLSSIDKYLVGIQQGVESKKYTPYYDNKIPKEKLKQSIYQFFNENPSKQRKEQEDQILEIEELDSSMGDINEETPLLRKF